MTLHKQLDSWVHRHNRKPNVEKYGISVEEQLELKKMVLEARRDAYWEGRADTEKQIMERISELLFPTLESKRI